MDSNNSLISYGACATCKRRKIKCIGNPCANCIKKGIACEFNDPKKRGPPQKKLKTILKDIQKTQNNNPMLCTIHESISNLYQQRSIVQLYFATLGTMIPKDFRSSLLEESAKSNALKCQLYTISAHVLNSLGQRDLASKYKKAALSVSPLSECFNFEMVVALLMLVVFMGLEDPQSWFYASTAFNITKMLPASDQTLRAGLFAQGLVSLCDPSITNRETRNNMLINILPKTKEPVCSLHEWLIICEVKLGVFHHSLLRFDSSLLYFPYNFLHPVLVEPSAIEEFQVTLAKLEELAAYEDLLQDQKAILAFQIPYNKFLMNWRLGNIEETTTQALKVMEAFKAGRFTISLRLAMEQLLLIPYFLQYVVASDIAVEAFTAIREVMDHQGKGQYFQQFCTEINAKLQLPCLFTNTQTSLPQIIEFSNPSNELLQIEPSLLSDLVSINSSEFDELCAFAFTSP